MSRQRVLRVLYEPDSEVRDELTMIHSVIRYEGGRQYVEESKSGERIARQIVERIALPQGGYIELAEDLPVEEVWFTQYWEQPLRLSFVLPPGSAQGASPQNQQALGLIQEQPPQQRSQK